MKGAGHLSVTIKDVAHEAGVSIATVSHVINKTRYVSREVEAKVNEVIDKTGYRAKILDKVNTLRVGRQSEIAFLAPSIINTTGSQAAVALARYLAERGFVLSIYVTNGDLKRERHILGQLITNKRVAGIVLNLDFRRGVKPDKVRDLHLRDRGEQRVGASFGSPDQEG